MQLALATLCLCLTPISERTGVVEDSASTIEIEHVYDDGGREILLQLLVWEATSEGQEIRSWRLWKTDQRPTRNFATGEWELIWNDGEATRVVRAKAFRESHRQYDTEMRRRSITPKEFRRPLTPLRDAPHELDLQLTP